MIAPFPPGPFSVILADPPWQYRDRCHAGKRGANYKYPLMDWESIASMPVADIAAKNSVLFMWATFPLLAEAIALFPRWGFTYKTIGFTWIKTNVKAGTPFVGMGNWTRSNAEVCLLGTRGRPKRTSASVSSVVLSPIRAHSQKPDEVRDRIVTLCGDVPRIELFARTTAPGWSAWGNQVGSLQEVA